MIAIRKSDQRGHFDHGWLDTYHTFSFADYQDPAHMGFSALRVINEDRVQPGEGFGTHPHRDMEIVTYVLQGALEHKDSMGNGSVIRPGEVQYMSAGTGVTHSEFNPSRAELVHLLQIWILPAERGAAPRYDQKDFPAEMRKGLWRLVVSPDGRDGSIAIRQDASLYARILAPGESAEFRLEGGRKAFVQVARGEVDLKDRELAAGDGAAIAGEAAFAVAARSEAEVLVFDLP